MISDLSLISIRFRVSGWIWIDEAMGPPRTTQPRWDERCPRLKSVHYLERDLKRCGSKTRDAHRALNLLDDGPCVLALPEPTIVSPDGPCCDFQDMEAFVVTMTPKVTIYPYDTMTKAKKQLWCSKSLYRSTDGTSCEWWISGEDPQRQRHHLDLISCAWLQAMLRSELNERLNERRQQQTGESPTHESWASPHPWTEGVELTSFSGRGTS